jgi:hypothetical protein
METCMLKENVTIQYLLRHLQVRRFWASRCGPADTCCFKNMGGQIEAGSASSTTEGSCGLFSALVSLPL